MAYRNGEERAITTRDLDQVWGYVNILSSGVSPELISK